MNPVFNDCVPMNIFGGLRNITPAARDYIVDDYKVAFQDTSQDFVEFVMTGDAWEGWGAGPVSAAFGASYRSEELDQLTPDPTDEYPATPSGVLLEDYGINTAGVRGLIEEYRPGGLAGSGIRNVPSGFRGDANSSSVTFSSLRAISGSYDVRDVFGELNIPIASDAGWANQFDVSTAVRWADYSGSGEIWAGKVGMNWQVSDAVRLRLTQSRDVRAATLRERFDQTRGGTTVRDPLKGNASISTASFSGGNPNVNPEEADTTTAGIVFQPTGLDGLSVSFDWYQIDINGAIAQLASQAVVDSCIPTNQSLCEYVIRDPVTQDIVRVDNLFINLQRQVIEGTDLELTYGFGNFNLRTFVTRLMENSVQNPGGVVDDRAGDIGGANAGLPDTKVTANLSWARGPLSLFIQERYIGGGTARPLPRRRRPYADRAAGAAEQLLHDRRQHDRLDVLHRSRRKVRVRQGRRVGDLRQHQQPVRPGAAADGADPRSRGRQRVQPGFESLRRARPDDGRRSASIVLRGEGPPSRRLRPPRRCSRKGRRHAARFLLVGRGEGTSLHERSAILAGSESATSRSTKRSVPARNSGAKG